MVYNVFASFRRRLDHYTVIQECTYHGQILDPERIANRAMYGTDYDPQDVGFGSCGCIR